MFEFLKKMRREFIFSKQVQYDEQNKPCVCGCSVKVLGNIKVRHYIERLAIKQALKDANEQHPKYNGFVQIW
jgi:hypothetical protein